jgi:hypothetical protein
LLSLPHTFPPTPHYSTAYISLHHRCNAFQYCWLSIILFPFRPPLISIQLSHYYKHVLQIHLYMTMFVLCICLSFGSIFHIWEKTCSLCLSELYFTYHNVLQLHPFTFKLHGFIHPYDWIKLHKKVKFNSIFLLDLSLDPLEIDSKERLEKK